ncbi:hypothetical protein IC614_03880 [Allosphingosinicella flava]|uniref:Uncharacterized protein n=1 Tax=Allosphingosinicella flava TaxID=2771430 RepID=A0A7T2GKV7_9SPHN|nr:hypothetical protein [Sphingosinicella flava]QPQ55738.1 hypothetical protein IC614_03880 [Sphingosinicella flava]
MSKQSREHTLNQIEANQSALRDSIENTKQLLDQSDRLIKQQRNDLDEDEDERETRRSIR